MEIYASVTFEFCAIRLDALLISENLVSYSSEVMLAWVADTLNATVHGLRK